MSKQDYINKANELNSQYKTINAAVNVSFYGGRLEIEVSTVEKAKICNELYPDFTFTSGAYK